MTTARGSGPWLASCRRGEDSGDSIVPGASPVSGAEGIVRATPEFLMNAPTRRLRIAAADDDREMRQFFQEVLGGLGHEVVAMASTGRELVERCRATSPDLVITEVKFADTDGIEAAAEVNREREVPVILVSADHDADLLARAGADHIMAYLTKPLKPPDLAAAISLARARFAQIQSIRKEATDLRQALEERKLIERAKGIAIRRMRIDEQDAFRRMRKLSSDRNLRLVQVARQLLAAEEIFTELEGIHPS
jgi:two-component system, response regulator PdtaR